MLRWRDSFPQSLVGQNKRGENECSDVLYIDSGGGPNALM